MRAVVAAIVLFMMMSGCIDGADGLDGETGNGANRATEATPGNSTNGTARHSFAYDGRTDGQLCSFVTQCVRFDDGENIEVEVAAPGSPIRLEAEATWISETPATEELAFFIIVETDDGGRSWDQDVPPVRGTSPAVIEWDLTRYSDKTVWIRASSLRLTVAVPQEFSLQGEITHSL